MARYIDADRLLKKLSRMIDYCKKDNKVAGLTALFQVGDAIMDCPTADVQEVRHGKWAYHYRLKKFVCLECGYETKHKPDFNYCPNCGAKMDKE